MHRLALATLCLCVLAERAAAAADALTLEWDGIVGCPDEASVRAALVRALARGPAGGAHAAIAVHAVITRDGAPYALELSLRTASGIGRKRLEALRCESFVDLIELELLLAATPSAPEPTSARRQSVARPIEARGDDGSTMAVGARLMAGGGVGPTPGLVPELSAAGWLRASALRFELGARYGLPTTARYDSEPAIGGRFDLFAASARACYSLGWTNIELPACAGAELGLIRGRGFGVEPAFGAQRPWAALLVLQAVRWPRAEMLSVWGELGVSASLLQPGFSVRNLGRLFRAEPWALRAAIGAELKID